jgi:hypothetical protein
MAECFFHDVTPPGQVAEAAVGKLLHNLVPTLPRLLERDDLQICSNVMAHGTSLSPLLPVDRHNVLFRTGTYPD